MSKKMLSKLIVFTMVIVLLAACSNNGGNSKPSNSPSTPPTTEQTEAPATEAPENTDPLKLTFYTDEAGITQENFDAWIGNSLKAKYPNSEFKYIPMSPETTLETLIASGEKFDVFFSSKSNVLEQYGLEYDMGPMIEEENIDLNRFESSLITGIKSSNASGAIHSLPLWTDSLILYYNKEIFDKFGEAYPENGMTWTEIIEKSKKLNRVDGEKKIVGLSFIPTHLAMYNQYSIPVLDPDTGKPTINTDPRWKNVYQLFQDATDNQVFQDVLTATGALPYTPVFLDGGIAMLVGNSNISYIYPEERLSAIDWDMVSLPTFEDMPNVGSQPTPYYVSIANTSTDKEAAMRAIKFLTSDDYQLQQARELGRIPVLDNADIKSQIGQDFYLKDKNFSAFTFNQIAPPAYQSPFNGIVRPIYGGLGIDLAKKLVDMNTAFASIEEQSVKAIEAAGTAK